MLLAITGDVPLWLFCHCGNVGSEGLPLLIFAQPGANSLAVEHEVLSTIAELKKDFPTGVDSIVIYDPTIFVAKSVREVATTIFVAILLVVGVVILFLQTWRASIIPVVAIPISLIGTFLVLYALGISLNNLSLFGLVLAVLQIEHVFRVAHAERLLPILGQQPDTISISV